MAIPRATARLQLHKDFTFDDAMAVVPYYASLGISHIYASPILTARAGSMHGYDIVDPTRINPELGGEEGLRRLVERIRAHGMGLILDIVPNHMGVGPENPWWQHVLEWGEHSPYARWFDIDWRPADETLHGKVMAPFLGQPYGDILAAGEIRLEFDAARGRFFVSYYAHRFPVAPETYADILRAAGAERLAPVLAVFEHDAGQQNAPRGFGMLCELAQDAEGAALIAAAIGAFAGNTAEGMERLHALLERQHYRLAWWRCAADGINWRRFFEVTELAGVRVEQDDVFEAIHALIFRLYTEGLIDGVRIDHVDGLADPGAYCRKLRARLQALSTQRPPELPPAPAWIVVEKILAHDEQLRGNWDIDGTSGYDFMDRVGAVLHDADGEAPLGALWTELTGQPDDFLAEVRAARRRLLANNLSGEFEAASRALHALARTDLRTRDFSLGAIRRVFTEFLVAFPVYRTYVDANGCDETDAQVIERALEHARQCVDRTERPLLDVLAGWFGGAAPRDAATPRIRHLHQRAITRFQQLTPPLAAKSVEDTAFYRYGRLLSRNEVGSDPGQFALDVAAFHDANRLRAERFPASLLATATHDHKRGEDVRMRIAALSEMPRDWAETVRAWMAMNAPLRAALTPDDDTPPHAPQAGDELMLYQTLVGAWPLALQPSDAEGLRRFVERVDQWQTKALREAKQVSNWVQPNEAYEAGCRAFLQTILDPAAGHGFLPALCAFVERIAAAGAAKSLAQTLLRMTCPGIPDLYQGTDMWDFSLVDPDNRRPVDYERRRAAMDDAGTGLQADDWHSGRLKQQLVARTLALRKRDPELFERGEYLPLAVDGPGAGRVIAFLRRAGRRTLLAAAIRLPCGTLADPSSVAPDTEAWRDTLLVLPAECGPQWADTLGDLPLTAADNRLRLSDVFARLPVALLMQDGAGA
ncbi:malto-oligosyltrehalose synthase [Noviherbaspirillum aridicola]|uniref:Malto-oligosyltrehalose synthase n=1 Tax=Noviherbaspirillum aridicola TaxID=2849687 RepID=A0ABQ4Q7V2_9BURK|nr:malto-oligosyltrehalose synthase [Noviherbaspirillum aridicola]GIZ53280.1 malto-oligosyltrehalose synthase [Noviherbaspirillum aridicola]